MIGQTYMHMSAYADLCTSDMSAIDPDTSQVVNIKELDNIAEHLIDLMRDDGLLRDGYRLYNETEEVSLTSLYHLCLYTLSKCCFL